MSELKKDPITDLLQVKKPEEILHQEAAMLDERSRKFLKERIKNPGIEDFMRESARYTRDALERVPKVTDLKAHEPSRNPLLTIFLGTTRVPNFALAIGVSLFLPLVLLLSPRSDPFDRISPRGELLTRITDISGVEQVNRELSGALKKRGIFLFEEAEKILVLREKTGFPNLELLKFYEDALSEFSQAYQLVKDPEVKDYLLETKKRIEALLD